MLTFFGITIKTDLRNLRVCHRPAKHTCWNLALRCQNKIQMKHGDKRICENHPNRKGARRQNIKNGRACCLQLPCTIANRNVKKELQTCVFPTGGLSGVDDFEKEVFLSYPHTLQPEVCKFTRGCSIQMRSNILSSIASNKKVVDLNNLQEIDA